VYHLDPERVLTLPEWALTTLVEHLPRFQAEEQQRAVTAALVPWMRPHSQRQFLHRLEMLTRIPVVQTPMEVLEHNPEKAREWFEQMGVIVQ